MTNAAKSVYYFGYYLLGLGLIITLVPNLLLGLFGLGQTSEVWIRVVGVLVFNIGLYYIGGAPSNSLSFLRMSVATRCLVLAAFIAFVLLKLAPPTLILFGAVDFGGAVWTWWALRRA